MEMFYDNRDDQAVLYRAYEDITNNPSSHVVITCEDVPVDPFVSYATQGCSSTTMYAKLQTHAFNQVTNPLTFNVNSSYSWSFNGLKYGGSEYLCLDDCIKTRKRALSSSLSGPNGEWTGDDDRNPGAPAPTAPPKAPKGKQTPRKPKGPPRQTQQPRTNAKKKRGPVQGARRQLRVAKHIWLRALENPFDPNVVGCKIPDTSRNGTGTALIHGASVLTIPTGTTTTVTFLPSPFYSIVAPNQGSGSQIPFSGGYNELNSTYYGTSPPTGVCVGTLTNLTQIQAIFDNYRVVAWGIRIRPLLPSTQTPVRMIFTPLKCDGQAPPYDVVDNNSFANVDSLVFGLTGSTPIASGASNMSRPKTKKCTSSEIDLGCWTFSGGPTGNRYYDFKPLSNEVTSIGVIPQSSAAMFNGVMAGEYIVANLSNGAVQETESAQAFQCNDSKALAVVFQNVVGTTANFEVEYIYHLEGVDNVQVYSGNIVPDSRDVIGCSQNLVDKIRGQAADITPPAGWRDADLNYEGSSRAPATNRQLQRFSNMRI
jgi:hypothetical protein